MIHIHGDYEWVEEPGHQSRVLEWVRLCPCGFSPDRLAWRVLITGSRRYKTLDAEIIYDALEEQRSHAEFLGINMVVVHGMAKGADTVAHDWALATDFVDPDPHPANWYDLGKRAGSVRNQLMVDLGANVCLAFPLIDSIGTWDCIRRAEEAGIPTKVFEP